MKYLLILCVLGSEVLSAVTALPVDDLDEKWEKFKIDYKRKYDPKEEIRRKQIFSSTVEDIEAHNKRAKDGLVSYALKINKFADWTDEEKQKMLRPDNFPEPSGI